MTAVLALHKPYTAAQVNPEPLTRGRGPVMADTLVERVTGQTTADHVNVEVEVEVVVPLAALLDGDSPLPAEVPGHGPVPVDVLARTEGRTMPRRLITRIGTVIGGPGTLLPTRPRRPHPRPTPLHRALLRRPRPPHRPHHPNRRRRTHRLRRRPRQLHNHLREQPGWWVDPRAVGGTRTTTPTGHTYDSSPTPLTAPSSLPGRPPAAAATPR